MSRYRESAYDDEDEDDLAPRRRETIMERRLRKARGEEVDDGLDDIDVEDDDDYIPRSLNRTDGPYMPRERGGSSGCVGGSLILVVGALAALLLIGLFFNQIFGRFGAFFSGGAPNIQTLIATPTPVIRSGAAVIQQIQQLNRLTTTSYTVERVIDVSQGSSVAGFPLPAWLGEDSLLLIAHGRVEAGIDLGKLRAEDITVAPDGKSLTVHLPSVEIFNHTLDNSKTRIYTRDRALLAPENPNLETQARQVAEQQILQAACEDGLMERATEDSKRAMEQFLKLLDFELVRVIAAPTPACPTP